MYNPDNTETIPKPPVNTVIKGAIIEIKDGKPSDFLEEEAAKKWRDNSVIKVVIEAHYQNQQITEEILFTYQNNDQGKTVYSENSKIGKFTKMYGGAPRLSQQVDLKANSDGYFKLIID